MPPDGLTGKFTIAPTDKSGRDHRALGTLRYVGEHYAQYAGSKKYFIQVGTQSPENFLAYWEFDDTVDHGGAENRLRDGLHRYEPHVRDWRDGDPTWKGGKGKGIIGALNYLAGKGMNTIYSLTMNIDGDGREIYPWTTYSERARYDVSKLAQWEIVFSHMDRLGLQLMLITQEEENEQILGKMTTLRKLYYRELIARFAHHHAILWDLSEEMDRWRYYTTADIQEICNYFKQLDPYRHPIQYVQWKGELVPDDKGYGRLLGFPNFDGTAMQHDPEFTHQATMKWVDASARAGHKWLVGVIEINPTSTGVVPDSADYWHDTVRKSSIWGNLMAGGSGSCLLLRLRLPEQRSRHGGLAQPRSFLGPAALRARVLHDAICPSTGCATRTNSRPIRGDYVFAKPGEVYAIYLPEGGNPQLDLTARYRRVRGQVVRPSLRRCPPGWLCPHRSRRRPPLPRPSPARAGQGLGRPRAPPPSGFGQLPCQTPHAHRNPSEPSWCPGLRVRHLPRDLPGGDTPRHHRNRHVRQCHGGLPLPRPQRTSDPGDAAPVGLRQLQGAQSGG